MKTGLLTIFAVGISAALTAGSLYASEPAALDADAAQTADAPAVVEDANPAAAAAIDADAQAGADTESANAVEPADAVATAGAGEAAPIETSAATSADAATAATDTEAIDASTAGASDASAEAGAIAESETDPASADANPARKVTLGKIGYDEQGRSGRIHVVVPGDTLWDISDAYLGTPWVWPSIWTDNRDIENPNLIVPGDRIWISAYEMRRVSAEEAERLLAGQPLAAGGEPAGPASDSFQSLLRDENPSSSVRISSLETSGLITAEQLEAAASIVDAIPNRFMLSEGDQVYIGLGDQQTSVGDQYTIFRVQEKVFDPASGRMLGYHINLLGWVEVKETDAEASVATIRMSAAEMGVGDRVMPRERPILDVEVAPSPKNVEGQISFFPSSRVLMGMADFVYLNRGEVDGLRVGSPLQVYRTGSNVPEPARDTRVDVPDHVIADLLVVRARSQSAVAFVRHTETELELGDHFRGAAD